MLSGAEYKALPEVIWQCSEDDFYFMNYKTSSGHYENFEQSPLQGWPGNPGEATTEASHSRAKVE